MAAWSNILRSTGEKVLRIARIFPKNAPQTLQIRNMSHGPRVFRVEPSRWQWDTTKDLVHFYSCIGIIPLTIITFGVYVFIGPATLTEIPEGYEPKHWEYYRNPITRFFMKTFNPSHQETYERMMAVIYDETRKQKITALQHKVKHLIKKRKDYQEYYYIPYNAEKVYENRKFHEDYEHHLEEFTEEEKQAMREGKYVGYTKSSE